MQQNVAVDRPEEIVVDFTDITFKSFDSDRLYSAAGCPMEILRDYTLEGWPKFVFDVRKFWYHLWN